MISMVIDMKTEDGLKRHAVMVVAKKFSWHMQTYSTINVQIYWYCYVLLWALEYNSELGVIISSEFFRAMKLQKKHYLLPSSFIYLFYLGNLFFI